MDLIIFLGATVVAWIVIIFAIGNNEPKEGG